MTQAPSRWSVATAEKDTGSIAAQHRTFLNSPMLAGLECVGVSCPLASWSRETSCSLRKLLWRRMRTPHWPWPTGFCQEENCPAQPGDQAGFDDPAVSAYPRQSVERCGIAWSVPSPRGCQAAFQITPPPEVFARTRPNSAQRGIERATALKTRRQCRQPPGTAARPCQIPRRDTGWPGRTKRNGSRERPA